LQRMGDRGMRGEELDRLIDIHREHVADAAFAQPDVERLAVEAPSFATLAEHFHVRQKAHLDGLLALACAGFAAATGGVEAEAARTPSADAGFARVGEEPADRVPETDVSGRAGARCLADRRLVDL